MLAVSLDNLLFFLLIAVAALFQLLSKAINKANIREIRTKHRAHPSHRRPDQFNGRHANPMRIGFVNPLTLWASRQPQLPLPLFLSY